MEHIPITFEHKSKVFLGQLSAVHGSGNSVWHLMDAEKFYLGRLRKINDKWIFDTTDKNPDLKELADFFGSYLICWYDSY